MPEQARLKRRWLGLFLSLADDYLEDSLDETVVFRVLPRWTPIS